MNHNGTPCANASTHGGWLQLGFLLYRLQLLTFGFGFCLRFAAVFTLLIENDALERRRARLAYSPNIAQTNRLAIINIAISRLSRVFSRSSAPSTYG